MRKTIYLFFTIMFVFTLSYNVIYGQDYATPSSETEKEQAEKEKNSIREKVQEKIENVKNNPKAYFGTVTDIADTTIQIKGENDEITQVSVNEEAITFVSIAKKTTEVSFEDLAIGDYVIAMGYTNGNNVLEGKRVLITSPLEVPARKVVFGTVVSIEKKTLILQAEEEHVVEFPRRWKGPEIYELEEGTAVIAVYEPDEDGELFIRTVEIVSIPNPSPTPEIQN